MQSVIKKNGRQRTVKDLSISRPEEQEYANLDSSVTSP